MKTCPSCGKGIGENTNFCPFCGAQCADDVNTDTQGTQNTQNPGNQTVYGSQVYTPGPVSEDELKTINGMSIAGLILGIVGIVFAFIPGVSFLGWICGVVGIVISSIAIAKAKKAGQKSGMAVGGLVLSILAILIGLIVVIVACIAGCAIAGTAGLL